MTNSNFDFEKYYSELEDIVKKLESGELSLQESINLYEKGMQISKQCSEFLNIAQQKIEYIRNTDDITGEFCCKNTRDTEN